MELYGIEYDFFKEKANLDRIKVNPYYSLLFNVFGLPITFDDGYLLIDKTQIRKLREQIELCLKTLTKREKLVLNLSFGLEYNAVVSDEKIGQKLFVTEEIINKIRETAIRKMRRLFISKKIKCFFYNTHNDEGYYGNVYQYFNKKLLNELDLFVKNGTLNDSQILKKINDYYNLELTYQEIKKMISNEASERNVELEAMDLSVRAYNCLKRSGINSLSELNEYSADDLISIPNMGNSIFEEVLEKRIHYNKTNTIYRKIISFNNNGEKVIIKYIGTDSQDSIILDDIYDTIFNKLNDKLIYSKCGYSIELIEALISMGFVDWNNFINNKENVLKFFISVNNKDYMYELSDEIMDDVIIYIDKDHESKFINKNSEDVISQMSFKNYKELEETLNRFIMEK